MALAVCKTILNPFMHRLELHILNDTWEHDLDVTKGILNFTFRFTSDELGELFVRRYFMQNCSGGVIVSVLVSGVDDREFEPLSDQNKDYTIGISCFSTKYAAFILKGKDYLARNQDNVFEWGDMSTCGLLFQWASTIKIQLSMLI